MEKRYMKQNKKLKKETMKTHDTQRSNYKTCVQPFLEELDDQFSSSNVIKHNFSSGSPRKSA
jgi:hypothetical protein